MLNFSVFQHEVLQDADEACKMAHMVFDASKVIPLERSAERIEEQIVKVPVPQITHGIAELLKLIQQLRIQRRTVDEMVCVCVSVSRKQQQIGKGDQDDVPGAGLRAHGGTNRLQTFHCRNPRT